MVDVVDAEKGMIVAMSDYVNNGGVSHFEDLVIIPSNKRPSYMRRCDKDDLIEIADNFRKTLSQGLNTDIHKLNLTYNNNNKSGSDFLEQNSHISVEIKLGSSTEANAGYGVITEHILMGQADLLTTPAYRKSLEKYAEEDDIETIWKLNDARGKNAVEYFNKFVGTPLNENGQKLITGYYNGITHSKESLGSSTLRQVLRLDLQPDHTWRIKTRPLLVDNIWFLNSFEYTDMHRFNFWVAGTSTEKMFRFTFNFKNKHVLTSGKKVEARLGLGRPSFNCWLR